MMVAPLEETRRAGRRNGSIDCHGDLPTCEPVSHRFPDSERWHSSTPVRAGGVVAGMSALFTVAALTVLGRSRIAPLSIRGAIAFAVFAVFVALAGSSQLILSRFDSDNWNDGRLDVYRDTLSMIAARPILGHGAGTFMDAFPAFHLLAPSGVAWNRTHDTYFRWRPNWACRSSRSSWLRSPGYFCTSSGKSARGLCPRQSRSPPSAPSLPLPYTQLSTSAPVPSGRIDTCGAGRRGVWRGGRKPMPVARGKLTMQTATTWSLASHRTFLAQFNVAIPATFRVLRRVHRSPSVPEGCRVYVFGDLHGRFDLLAKA